MWKTELKSLVKNKVLLISVLVIACIPTLYAAVFLGSIWDPYSKTEHLSIAVVNEDVAVEYENKTLAIGEELVKNLKDNKTFTWEFVKTDEAKSGLETGKYYMIINIPENFSENAATVLDDQPKKLELTFETNPGYNMLGDLIMKTGASEINANIREQVTKEYVNTLVSQFKDIGDSLDKASDGAVQLFDGSEDLLNGNQELTSNLQTLVDSTLLFSDGMNQIDQGTSQYLDGVNSLNAGLGDLNKGTTALVENIGPLQDGITQLNAGSNSLVSGLKMYTEGVYNLNKGSELLAQQNENLSLGMKSLYNGLTTFQDEFSQLPESAQALLVGSQQIQQGIISVDEAVKALGVGTSGIVAGVEQLSCSIPSGDQVQALLNVLNPEVFNTLSAEQQAGVLTQAIQLASGYKVLKESVDNELLPAATQVNNGLSSLSQQVPSLVAGSNQLTDGLNLLAEKLPSVTEGIKQLVNGSSTLYDGLVDYTTGVGELNSGANTLASNSSTLLDGASQLADGISVLYSKMPTLISGVTQLNNGSLQLFSGSQTLVKEGAKLASGIKALVSGAGELQDGSSLLHNGSVTLGEGLATMSSGSSELASQLGDGAVELRNFDPNDSNITMMATPTDLNHVEDTIVPNYGNALSPYFISVALYVGALVFSVIYPIKRCVEVPKSAASWWSSKCVVILGQALLQSVVISFIMFGIMGLEVYSLWRILVVVFITSLTYLFITSMLASAFGNPGRFIAMVILVLQIGSAGGTFPIELTNEFYKFFNPLLPMTYSIDGLREGMFGAMGSATYLTSIVVLLGFLIAMIVLFFVAFKVSFKKQKFEIEEL